MGFYERKIRYLDYLEYENKIKNAGFVKTEVSDENCKIQIMIKGLYPTDTLQGDVYLFSCGKAYKVETILLRFGTSSYISTWDTRNLSGSGISYEKWDGIEIRLSEHRVLRNLWREVKEAPEEAEETMVGLSELQEVETVGVTEEHIVGEIVAENLQVQVLDGVKVAEKAYEPAESVDKTFRFQSLYEDKWTQLTQHYRTIHPFGDERSYLSIKPEDFIILRGQYQKLVGNSFLLHGYYNYGHVLLERQERDGYCNYYLGVPGIYHEREKQVAGMFGFEGFEGAKSPYVEGSFGYYMHPVEI